MHSVMLVSYKAAAIQSPAHFHEIQQEQHETILSN